jgi:hypothetical protein
MSSFFVRRFLIVQKMRQAEFRSKITREIQYHWFCDGETIFVAAKRSNSGSSENICAL